MTALKTISARIRGSKSELAELGEDTEELAEGFSKYAKEIKAISGVNIMVEGTTNEFKDLYDIFSDIAVVWDTLSDTQQARIAEILGGTRQLQVISSILNNWEDAAGAYADAMTAAGVATDAQAKYAESIKGKLGELKASFQEMSLALLDGSVIKFFIEMLNGIVNATTATANFIEKCKALKVLLIALFTVLSLTTVINLFVTGFKKIVTLFSNIIHIIPNAITAWKAYSAAKVAVGDAETVAAAKTAAASAAIQASIPVIGLILAAITALVAGVALASSKSEEATDKFDDTGEKIKQLGDTAKSDSKNIVGLANTFLEAKAALSELTGSVEQYTKARDALIEGLQVEQTELDKLIEKYGDLDKAILVATLDTLKKNAVDLSGSIKQQADELINYTNHAAMRLQADQDSVKFNGVMEGIEALENMPEEYRIRFVFDYIEEGETGFFGFTNDPTEEMEKVYGRNAKFVQNYYSYLEALKILADTVGRDNPLYKELYSEYSVLKEPVEKLISDTKALNENLAEQSIVSQTLTSGVPKTADGFNEFRQKCIDATVAADGFCGTAEDAGYIVDDMLRHNSSFASFFDTRDTKDDIYVLTDLSKLLTKLKSDYDLLATAEKEMAEGGLTPSTIKSIKDALDGSGENYLDYLYEENGVIKLNTEAWKERANIEMQNNILAIEAEIKALEDQRDALKNAKVYQDDYVGAIEEGAYYESDYTSAVEDNNAAIEENQRKLGIYSAIYDSVTNSTEDVISTIVTLEDELKAVTAAYERYKNGFKDGEKGDAFKNQAEAYKAARELYEKGLTGTNQYKSAIEYLFGEDAVFDSGFDYESFGSKLGSAFFEAAFGGEGGDFGAGAAQYLLEHAEEFGDAISVSQGENGISIAVHDAEALAEQLGISEDMVWALIDAWDAWDSALTLTDAELKKMSEDFKSISESSGTYTVNVGELVTEMANAGKSRKEIMETVEALRGFENVKIEGDFVDTEAMKAAVDEAVKDAEKKAEEANTELTLEVDDTEVKNTFDQWDGKRATVYVDFKRGRSVTPLEAEASGTDSARGGETLVNERGAEIITANGKAYIAGAGDPTIVDLPKGAQVFNAKETRDIISRSGIDSRGLNGSGIDAFAGGTGNQGGIGGIGSLQPGKPSGGSGSGGKNDKENWFEKQYKLHKHLLAMDAEEVEDYLKWLNDAYKKAYDEGLIDLDEYRKYCQEVYKGLQDLFKDYLNDIEHEISMRENFEGENKKIISLYEELIAAVEKEIADARALGLDDTDDYVQELQDKWKQQSTYIRKEYRVSVHIPSKTH